VIHVKDRVVPSGLTGLGFQTVQPFHADCISHYTKHGFGYMGMKTIVTDVVRENNQTYRLGWTEQLKDGSKMGCGMPEYLLLFRKPPTDRSNGYADEPVVKGRRWWDMDRREWDEPDGYSLGRWQLDAHGFLRSSGDRLLTGADIEGVPHHVMYKLWKKNNLSTVYDYEAHVKLCESLTERGALPVTFMLFPPHSWHPDVWSDVARMRTLNSTQQVRGKEMHLCPMQFDTADRAIKQLSSRRDIVLDPFAGLGTVPLRAVKAGRIGMGIELSPTYYKDAVTYLREAAQQQAIPSLFDLIAVEQAAPAEDAHMAASGT
jgi:hypothetical protein